MGMAYCKDCLVRTDMCECGNPSNEMIFGRLRVAYEEGYRQGLKGRREDESPDQDFKD